LRKGASSSSTLLFPSPGNPDFSHSLTPPDPTILPILSSIQLFFLYSHPFTSRSNYSSYTHIHSPPDHTILRIISFIHLQIQLFFVYSHPFTSRSNYSSYALIRSPPQIQLFFVYSHPFTSRSNYSSYTLIRSPPESNYSSSTPIRSLFTFLSSYLFHLDACLFNLLHVQLFDYLPICFYASVCCLSLMVAVCLSVNMWSVWFSFVSVSTHFFYIFVVLFSSRLWINTYSKSYLADFCYSKCKCPESGVHVLYSTSCNKQKIYYDWL
jgi:hypothetical protein